MSASSGSFELLKQELINIGAPRIAIDLASKIHKDMEKKGGRCSFKVSPTCTDLGWLIKHSIVVVSEKDGELRFTGYAKSLMASATTEPAPANTKPPKHPAKEESEKRGRHIHPGGKRGIQNNHR